MKLPAHVEWDDSKNAAKRKKHRIGFETAALVFLDPWRIEIYDDRQDYGEDRWITIGAVESVLVVVAYTFRGSAGDKVRVISARKANDEESEAYYRHQS